MVSCESTRSYKVPLKACRNTVIEHNLVTIWLSVEWPEKGGDDPNLVIDIKNNQPSSPYLHPNQSSFLGNSIHPHHPHQGNVDLTHQQQYYHSSALNNHDRSSNSTITANTINDHSDVLSTTTTTVVYNSNPSRLQTSTSSSLSEIQKIKSDLQSPFFPNHGHRPSMNQQYLSSQHVIHTPLPSMNDPRLDTKTIRISPPASIKPIHPLIPQFTDIQQSSSMTCPPSTIINPLKSVVCMCPNPTAFHFPNCPISASNNQNSNTHLSPDSMHRSPMSRPNTQLIVPGTQVHTQGAFSISSTKEPMVSTTYVPFSNPNIMKIPDSSSGVPTIISQQPSFLNTAQLSSTTKSSSFDTGNIFQHPPLSISQINPNNQSIYQISPSPVEQQNTAANNSRSRKKFTTQRNSTSHQDEALIQNLNNLQSQNHLMNNHNSPIKQQTTHSPSLLSSPMQIQQGMFIFQDNSQITDTSVCTTPNDNKVNIKQQQPSPPCIKSMVRSPVKLDIPLPPNSTQTKNVSDPLEEIITDVVNGKGEILVKSPQKSTTSQQQKQLMLSKIVCPSNGPLPTTRTYLSSPIHEKQQPSTDDAVISSLNRQNVAERTSPVIHLNFPEQSQANTLTHQQQPPKTAAKRRRATSKFKKTTNNSPQPNIASSSASTPTLLDKRMSWSDTPRSLPSSGNLIAVPTDNMNQHLPVNSLSLPDIDHNDDLLDSVFSDEQMDMMYSDHDHDQNHTVFDDLFPSTPSMSITEPMLHSVPAEKLSNSLPTLMSNIDYEAYLREPTSSTWEENQSRTLVSTPPNVSNNSLSEQQYFSQTNTFFDTNSQSQTLSLQVNETNLNTINPMNNNDDVQTSSKTTTTTQQQQQKQIKKPLKNPSKITKQRNRPNIIRKSSTTEPKCTRCGSSKLLDITHHEFPKQKGLLFECPSCGNNSIRSNVSAKERKRRLDKVAADHLNTVVCQFCHKLCHSHNEYLIHLKDDHGSNKPM